jgi:cystathionine beta-lyase/cystathionine gamma-synthase
MEQLSNEITVIEAKRDLGAISLVIDPVSKMYCRSNSSIRMSLAHKLETRYKRNDTKANVHEQKVHEQEVHEQDTDVVILDFNEESTPNEVAYESNVWYKLTEPVCHITSSGMNAISSIMEYFLRKDHDVIYDVIYANELYCDTPRLFNHMKRESPGRIYLSQFNVNDQDSLPDYVTRLKENNKREAEHLLPGFAQRHKTLIFFESCSNPHSVPFKFELIADIKDKHSDVIFICDNTWLTDALCNPFIYGVDIVVTSLTKYYSGGKAICGAILGPQDVIESIETHDRITGKHVSNYSCAIVLDMIRKVDKRISRSSQKTKDILQYLEYKKMGSGDNKSSKIGKIYYPPTYKNGLIPSICTFTIQCSKTRTMKFLNAVTSLQGTIQFITSFGGENSRIDPWPTTSDGYTHIRIAIGYDHNESDSREIMTTIDALLSLI